MSTGGGRPGPATGCSFAPRNGSPDCAVTGIGPLMSAATTGFVCADADVAHTTPNSAAYVILRIEGILSVAGEDGGDGFTRGTGQRRTNGASTYSGERAEGAAHRTNALTTNRGDTLAAC